MRSGHNSIHALPIVSKWRRRRRRRHRCRSQMGKKRITIWRNFTLSSCVTNIRRGIAWITQHSNTSEERTRFQSEIQAATLLLDCRCLFEPLFCWLRLYSVFLLPFLHYSSFCFSRMLFIVVSSNIAKQNEIQLTLTFVRQWCRPFVYIFYLRLGYFFFSSPHRNTL